MTIICTTPSRSSHFSFSFHYKGRPRFPFLVHQVVAAADSLNPPATSAGFGKRPASGVSFIKAKQKRKQANLVKDFIFSSVDEEGQMVMLFPISINLTEVLERFGQLSVSIVCSAIEQELRDQGEVRLVFVDARGQPIMDSSQTGNKSL